MRSARREPVYRIDLLLIRGEARGSIIETSRKSLKRSDIKKRSFYCAFAMAGCEKRRSYKLSRFKLPPRLPSVALSPSPPRLLSFSCIRSRLTNDVEGCGRAASRPSARRVVLLHSISQLRLAAYASEIIPTDPQLSACPCKVMFLDCKAHTCPLCYARGE